MMRFVERISRLKSSAWTSCPSEIQETADGRGVDPTVKLTYSPIDDVIWQLARFRALDIASIIIVFGHETGQRELVREGTRTLDVLAIPGGSNQTALIT
jgi:hypothetical protein